MIIEIIQAGRYLNNKLRAAKYQAGDLLDVSDEYAQSLIGSGYARKPLRLSSHNYYEEPASDVQTVPAVDFSDLPGVDAEINEAIHKYGILTIDQFKEALINGRIVNIPGIGFRKRHRLIEHFDLKGDFS